jgi:hypothetical protein
MKTRPLPATELAEQCLRPEDEQLSYLRRFYRAGRRGGQGSYRPTRLASPDILNVQAPMVGTLPPTPWEKIEDLIVRRSSGDIVNATKNLLVSRSLYDYVTVRGITGRRLEGPSSSVPIGLMGVQTKFWESTAIVIARRLYLCFLDLRRKFGLTTLGERVVFSFMNEIVRRGYAEYAGAGMLILQFANDEGRTIAVRNADVEKFDLLTFDDLQRLTARTYELWLQVQAEGDNRASGEDPGPLFGGKSA